MAADQWRKRLNSASVVSCHGMDQHRSKRKNLGSSQFDSNMKSHISLKWDGNQKRVVARKEQVGISWRDVRPISGSSNSVNNIVADVFAVPNEIYGLENLDDVLSYEVWDSYLSESEKTHLMQFLPRGLETEQVLQSLLSGDNFHFGNPLLNWGSLVCSGELHPDSIRQQDQCLKTAKKAYYAQLHDYHNKMIADLLKLKERFEQCKDPEEEFTRKTVRVSKKGSLRENGGNLPGDVNLGENSRKGDERQQKNISCNDGAEYMSYVKISKKQHDIVKNMKQSGKSIQSKSLNQVLGNIDSFNIQPYEVFVKEEQKKLREHWIKLANEALPKAFANWSNLNLQRQQLRKSLEQDINDRLRNLIEVDDGIDNQDAAQDQIETDTDSRDDAVLDDQIENRVEDHIPTPELNSQRSLSGSHQMNSQEDFSSEKDSESMDVDSEKQTFAKSEDGTLDHSAEEYSGNNGGGGDDEIGEGVEEEEDRVMDTDRILGWPTGDISHSYYDSTQTHEYGPDSGLTIAPLKTNEENDEQLTNLVDLESELHIGDSGKEEVHRQQDTGSFGSYSNQDRNELFQIQSLFKGEDMLMYNHQPHHQHHHNTNNHHHHQQQQPPHQNNNSNPHHNHMLIEDGHFPSQMLHQPLLPMDHGLKRENEPYLRRNMAENVYSDGGRFLISRPEGLPGVDVQDWGAGMPPPPLPPPPVIPPHQNELTNWFSSDHHQVGQNQSRIGGDQSLFSVLSQCNQLSSSNNSNSNNHHLHHQHHHNHHHNHHDHHPYQAAGSADQFLTSARSYGGAAVMGPMNASLGNVGGGHPLEYMSNGTARDDAAVAADMGWIPPRQSSSSGLHDPPYLRSWNQ